VSDKKTKARQESPRRKVKDVFEWRDTVLSKSGPCPTTRLVLSALGKHMNKTGGSCYPSYELLVEETGLSLRSVKRHMNLANNEGWFKRSEKKGHAKGWRRYDYQATLPLVDTDAPPTKDIVVTESA